jgi:hypothetical protein
MSSNWAILRITDSKFPAITVTESNDSSFFLNKVKITKVEYNSFQEEVQNDLLFQILIEYLNNEILLLFA